MDGINECCRLRVNYSHSLLERTLAPASALASREWAMVTTVTICAWTWRNFKRRLRHVSVFPDLDLPLSAPIDQLIMVSFEDNV
jgi:hypothetical protein